MRQLKLSIKFVVTPLKEFTRYWEQDRLGQRLLRMVIEILAMVHLIRLLAPLVLT